MEGGLAGPNVRDLARFEPGGTVFSKLLYRTSGQELAVAGVLLMMAALLSMASVFIVAVVQQHVFCKRGMVPRMHQQHLRHSKKNSDPPLLPVTTTAGQGFYATHVSSLKSNSTNSLATNVERSSNGTPPGGTTHTGGVLTRGSAGDSLAQEHMYGQRPIAAGGGTDDPQTLIVAAALAVNRRRRPATANASSFSSSFDATSPPAVQSGSGQSLLSASDSGSRSHQQQQQADAARTTSMSSKTEWCASDSPLLGTRSKRTRSAPSQQHPNQQHARRHGVVVMPVRQPHGPPSANALGFSRVRWRT